MEDSSRLMQNLSTNQYKMNLLKSFLATFIVVYSFFIPLTINGEKVILFGYICSFLVKVLGKFWLFFITLLMGVNFILYIVGKIKKSGKIYEYYQDEGIFRGLLYFLGFVYIFLYVTQIGPEWLINRHVSGTVIDDVVLQVGFIIPLGGLFMPLILKYGCTDFIGTLMEPLMRPCFKCPGISAVNAMASFVTSSSLGVYLTSKFYENKNYTQKECVLVATSFSAVSVGFAALAVATVDLLEKFTVIYFSAFLITFLIAAIISRIPPLSRKKDIFIDEKEQTEDMKNEDAKFNIGLLKKGLDKAVIKVEENKGIFKEISEGILDGIIILPKVIPLLAAVGITGLLIANNTPLFNVLGLIIYPILKLLRVPDALQVSSAILVGICEMYLPVLLIAGKGLSEAARYFVTTVALVQIITFSETVVVMIATKLPISFKEIVVVFLLRTLIALPLTALFMHIIF